MTKTVRISKMMLKMTAVRTMMIMMMMVVSVFMMLVRTTGMMPGNMTQCIELRARSWLQKIFFNCHGIIGKFATRVPTPNLALVVLMTSGSCFKNYD